MRRVTVYASNPYSPIATSVAATMPKSTDNIAIKRSGRMDASTCSASVVTFATGTFGSTSCTARRTLATTDIGGTSVRSTNVKFVPAPP